MTTGHAELYIGNDAKRRITYTHSTISWYTKKHTSYSQVHEYIYSVYSYYTNVIR